MEPSYPVSESWRNVKIKTEPGTAPEKNVTQSQASSSISVQNTNIPSENPTHSNDAVENMTFDNPVKVKQEKLNDDDLVWGEDEDRDANSASGPSELQSEVIRRDHLNNDVSEQETVDRQSSELLTRASVETNAVTVNETTVGETRRRSVDGEELPIQVDSVVIKQEYTDSLGDEDSSEHHEQCHDLSSHHLEEDEDDLEIRHLIKEELPEDPVNYDDNLGQDGDGQLEDTNVQANNDLADQFEESVTIKHEVHDDDFCSRFPPESSDDEETKAIYLNLVNFNPPNRQDEATRRKIKNLSNTLATYTMKPLKPNTDCQFFSFIVSTRKKFNFVDYYLRPLKDYKQLVIKKLIEKEDERKRIKELNEGKEVEVVEPEDCGELPSSFQDFVQQINGSSQWFIKSDPTYNAPILKDIRTTNCKQFKLKLMSYLNECLAYEWSQFDASEPGISATIKNANNIETNSEITLTVPMDTNGECLIQFGMMVLITVEDQEVIANVVEISPQPNVHNSIDYDVNVSGNAIVEGVLANLVPGSNCEVKIIGFIQSYLLKGKMILNLDPDSNPVHKQLVDPLLTSYNSMISPDISESTKKRFDDKSFYFDCIQKACDTICHDYQDSSYFCAFDDKSNSKLITLAIEIIRTFIKQEKNIGEARRTLLSSYVKSESKEDENGTNVDESKPTPDVEIVEDYKVKILLTAATESQLESLIELLVASQIKFYHVAKFGKQQSSPTADELWSQTLTMLYNNLARTAVQLEHGLIKEEGANEQYQLRSELYSIQYNRCNLQDPRMIVEWQKLTKLSKMKFIRDAEVIVGTINDFLNDELINVTCIMKNSTTIKFDAAVIYDATFIDETFTAALLNCEVKKMVLIGNTGQVNNDNCSLMKRLIKKYEANHDDIREGSKCSVVSSFRPVRLGPKVDLSATIKKEPDWSALNVVSEQEQNMNHQFNFRNHHQQFRGRGGHLNNNHRGGYQVRQRPPINVNQRGRQQFRGSGPRRGCPGYALAQKRKMNTIRVGSNPVLNSEGPAVRRHMPRLPVYSGLRQPVPNNQQNLTNNRYTGLVNQNGANPVRPPNPVVNPIRFGPRPSF